MTVPNWTELPAMSTLRAFEATARLGGYSAAARSLNVTPAAIAQQVRKLEAEIGATLVRRKGRGLVLTPAGEGLAQPLRDAFAQIARAVDEARLEQSARGVRVSTTDFFVDALIVPDLTSLWVAHPGLQVSFSPDGNTAPLDFEAYDVAIRGAGLEPEWAGLEFVQLLRTPLIVFGRPDIGEANGNDLAKMPWIRDRTLGDGVFEAVVTGLGLEQQDLTLVDPNSGRFELEAALQGHGLVIGPELTMRDYLREGRLQTYAVPPGMVSAYYAITPPGRKPEPVLKFLGWLTELCARAESSDAP